MGAGAVERQAGIENIIDEEHVSAAKVSSAVFQAANLSGGAGALVARDIPKLHLGIGIEVAEEVDDKEDTAFEEGNDGEWAFLVGLANRGPERSDASLDGEGGEVGLARGAGH